VGAVLD